MSAILNQAFSGYAASVATSMVNWAMTPKKEKEPFRNAVEDTLVASLVPAVTSGVGYATRTAPPALSVPVIIGSVALTLKVIAPTSGEGADRKGSILQFAKSGLTMYVDNALYSSIGERLRAASGECRYGAIGASFIAGGLAGLGANAFEATFAAALERCSLPKLCDMVPDAPLLAFAREGATHVTWDTVFTRLSKVA